MAFQEVDFKDFLSLIRQRHIGYVSTKNRPEAGDYIEVTFSFGGVVSDEVATRVRILGGLGRWGAADWQFGRYVSAINEAIRMAKLMVSAPPAEESEPSP